MKDLIRNILQEEVSQLSEKFKIGPDEYVKLFKNDNFELVVPLTIDASKKYGANTKWCTTSNCDDAMFDKHNRMGSLAYIIIKDKELLNRFKSGKFGLYVNKPSENYLGGKFPAPSGIMVYDDRNEVIRQSELENEFDKVDMSSDYYKMIRKFNEYTENKFNSEIVNEEVNIEPSLTAQKNICNSEKFCSTQGPITFGQLRAIVDAGMSKRLKLHVGEGTYKAILRMFPWFVPQVAVAGMLGAAVRAANKIFGPTLTETTSYKTWWGKTILRLFKITEGELNPTDPFSKIFFVSDGLMTLLDEENKVKFARYISNLASEMSNEEPVPEYFVENELRNWINQRFLLDPPLGPKTIKENVEDKELNLMYKILNRIIGTDNIYEGSYDLPYSDELMYNEGVVDVLIKYDIDPKTHFWKTNEYGGDYKGTIYLRINEFYTAAKTQTYEEEWERMYSYYDIPEWIWDDIEEDIIKKIRKVLSDDKVDFDFDYVFDKK